MSANIIRLLPDEERALLECYVAGSQHPASFQQLFDTMEVPTDAVPDRLQIAVAQILGSRALSHRPRPRPAPAQKSLWQILLKSPSKK